MILFLGPISIFWRRSVLHRDSIRLPLNSEPVVELFHSRSHVTSGKMHCQQHQRGDSLFINHNRRRLFSLSLGIFIFANCPPLALLLLLGVDWSRVPISNVAPSPFPSTHTHTHKIQTAALLFRKHAYFHHGVYENGAAREEIFCKIKL